MRLDVACSLKMDVSLYGTVAVRDVEVRRSREILVPAAPSSSSMPWSGLSGDDPLSYLREIGDRIAAILDPNHDDSGVGTGDGSGVGAGVGTGDGSGDGSGVGSGVGTGVGIGDGEEETSGGGSTDGDRLKKKIGLEKVTFDKLMGYEFHFGLPMFLTNPDTFSSLRVQVPALEAETSVYFGDAAEDWQVLANDDETYSMRYIVGMEVNTITTTSESREGGGRKANKREIHLLYAFSAPTDPPTIRSIPLLIDIAVFLFPFPFPFPFLL